MESQFTSVATPSSNWRRKPSMASLESSKKGPKDGAGNRRRDTFERLTSDSVTNLTDLSRIEGSQLISKTRRDLSPNVKDLLSRISQKVTLRLVGDGHSDISLVATHYYVPATLMSRVWNAAPALCDDSSDSSEMNVRGEGSTIGLQTKREGEVAKAILEEELSLDEGDNESDGELRARRTKRKPPKDASWEPVGYYTDLPSSLSSEFIRNPSEIQKIMGCESIRRFAEHFNERSGDRKLFLERAKKAIDYLKKEGWEYKDGIRDSSRDMRLYPKEDLFQSTRENFLIFFSCRDSGVETLALHNLIELLEADPITDVTANHLVDFQEKIHGYMEEKVFQAYSIEIQRLLIRVYALGLQSIYLHSGSTLNAITLETREKLWRQVDDLDRINLVKDPEIRFWHLCAIESGIRIKDNSIVIEQVLIIIARVIGASITLASQISEGEVTAESFVEAFDSLIAAYDSTKGFIWSKWYEPALLVSKLGRVARHSVEIFVDSFEPAVRKLKELKDPRHPRKSRELFFSLVSTIESTLLHTHNKEIMERGVKLLMQFIEEDEEIRDRVVSSLNRFAKTQKSTLKSVGKTLILLLNESGPKYQPAIIREVDPEFLEVTGPLPGEDRIICESVARFFIKQLRHIQEERGLSTTLLTLLTLSGSNGEVHRGQSDSYSPMEGLMRLIISMVPEAADPDIYGRTAIMTSLEKKNTEMLRCALKVLPKGAVNHRAGNGSTALTLTLTIPYLDALPVLARSNPDPNVSDKTGRTFLHVLAERCRSLQLRPEDISVLFNHERVPFSAYPDVNFRDHSGKTPLGVAAENGHKTVVNIFLDHGGDPFTRAVDGLRPLDHMIIQGMNEEVIRVISSPEYSTKVDPYDTAIISAARNEAFSILGNLVKFYTEEPGIQPFSLLEEDESKLDEARYQISELEVRAILLLIERNCTNLSSISEFLDIHIQKLSENKSYGAQFRAIIGNITMSKSSEGGYQVLRVSSGNSQILDPKDLSRFIIGNFRPRKSTDKTPQNIRPVDLIPNLFPASNIPSLTILDQVNQLFRSQPSLINETTPFGLTLYHAAVYSGKSEVAKRLMDGGANVRLGDCQGFTPLHTACHMGLPQVVSDIIEKYRRDGVQGMACNQYGIPAWMYCVGVPDHMKFEARGIPDLPSGSFERRMECYQLIVKASESVKQEMTATPASFRDRGGRHVGHYCVLYSDPRMVNKIFSENPELFFIPDSNGMLPIELLLHHVSTAVKIPRLKMMLEAQAETMSEINRLTTTSSSNKTLSKSPSLIRSESSPNLSQGLISLSHVLKVICPDLSLPLLLAEHGIRTLFEAWINVAPDHGEGFKTRLVHKLVEHKKAALFGLCGSEEMNLLDEQGNTPAILACVRGDLTILQRIKTINPSSISISNRHRQNCVHILSSQNLSDSTYASCLSTVLEIDSSLLFQTDASGRTPVHTMALHDNHRALEIVERFVINQFPFELGVDTKQNRDNRLHYLSIMDGVDDEGRTPFLCACSSGSDDIVRHFLEKRFISDTAQDRNGLNAAHLAAQEGHESILKLLFDEYSVCDHQGRSLASLTDSMGETVFHKACSVAHEEAVDYLLDLQKRKNLLVNFITSRDTLDGESSLIELVKTRVGTRKATLFGSRSRTREEDRVFQMTSSSVALEPEEISVRLNIARKLIKAGARTREFTQSRRNFWHHAAIQFDREFLHSVYRIAIRSGSSAELSEKDIHGMTPLHVAALNGNCSACRFFLRKGVKISLDREGYSPLHLAALSGHSNVVSALIEAGAKPIQLVTPPGPSWVPSCVVRRSSHRSNILHLLLTSPSLSRDMEELLLNLVRNHPNLLLGIDEAGRNPLHIASMNGHRRICDLILQRVPLRSPETKRNYLISVDGSGNTPAQLAQINGYRDLYLFIMNYNSSQVGSKAPRTWKQAICCTSIPDVVLSGSSVDEIQTTDTQIQMTTKHRIRDLSNRFLAGTQSGSESPYTSRVSTLDHSLDQTYSFDQAYRARVFPTPQSRNQRSSVTLLSLRLEDSRISHERETILRRNLLRYIIAAKQLIKIHTIKEFLDYDLRLAILLESIQEAYSLWAEEARFPAIHMILSQIGLENSIQQLVDEIVELIEENDRIRVNDEGKLYLQDVDKDKSLSSPRSLPLGSNIQDMSISGAPTNTRPPLRRNSSLVIQRHRILKLDDSVYETAEVRIGKISGEYPEIWTKEGQEGNYFRLDFEEGNLIEDRFNTSLGLYNCMLGVGSYGPNYPQAQVCAMVLRSLSPDQVNESHLPPDVTLGVVNLGSSEKVNVVFGVLDVGELPLGRKLNVLPHGMLFPPISSVDWNRQSTRFHALSINEEQAELDAEPVNEDLLSEGSDFSVMAYKAIGTNGHRTMACSPDNMLIPRPTTPCEPVWIAGREKMTNGKWKGDPICAYYLLINSRTEDGRLIAAICQKAKTLAELIQGLGAMSSCISAKTLGNMNRLLGDRES